MKEGGMEIIEDLGRREETENFPLYSQLIELGVLAFLNHSGDAVLNYTKLN